MANFKLEVCRASCSHPTGYGTVTADQRTHLDEQTLASKGYVDIGIKWKGPRSGVLVDNHGHNNDSLSYTRVISFQLTETLVFTNT